MNEKRMGEIALLTLKDAMERGRCNPPVDLSTMTEESSLKLARDNIRLEGITFASRTKKNIEDRSKHLHVDGVTTQEFVQFSATLIKELYEEIFPAVS